MQGWVLEEDSDNETGELVLQSWSVFLGDARRKTLEASIHVHHHLLDLCRILCMDYGGYSSPWIVVYEA